MEAYPERFPLDDHPQAFFGRHPNQMLLAFCVVKCFWNRRIKDGDKFTIYRKRASRTQIKRPLAIIGDDLAGQAQQSPTAIDDTVVPGVPNLPQPKQDKPKTTSKAPVKKTLTDAVRTLQLC